MARPLSEADWKQRVEQLRDQRDRSVRALASMVRMPDFPLSHRFARDVLAEDWAQEVLNG